MSENTPADHGDIDNNDVSSESLQNAIRRLLRLLQQRPGLLNVLPQPVNTQNGSYEEVAARALAVLIGELQAVEGMWRVLPSMVEAACPKEDRLNNVLQEVMNSFNRDVWVILRARHLCGERLTHDAIATQYAGGVSRARVHQIEKRGVERIENMWRTLYPVLWQLERWENLSLLNTGIMESGLEEADAEDSPHLAQLALRRVWYVLVACGAIDPSDETGLDQAERFIVIVRALVRNHNQEILREFPKLTYVFCMLPPAVLEHPQVGGELRSRVAQAKRWSSKRVCQEILQEAGEPLHYTEVTRRAEMLAEAGKCRNFSMRLLHNTLGSHPKVFALVAPGRFGLRSQGFNPVNSYVDIIAAILKRNDKPLSYGDILQQVNEERLVKETSLKMLLSMNPRFYESVNGGFGLRARLPAREKQTLRTPNWLIETQKSRERLERAAKQGYNIEAIVSQDM